MLIYSPDEIFEKVKPNLIKDIEICIDGIDDILKNNFSFKTNKCKVIPPINLYLDDIAEMYRNAGWKVEIISHYTDGYCLIFSIPTSKYNMMINKIITDIKPKIKNVEEHSAETIERVMDFE